MALGVMSLARKALFEESMFAAPCVETELDGDSNDRTTAGNGGETLSSLVLPVYPEPFLKPRGGLNGMLRSMDGTASLYTSRDSGFLMHEKSEAAASSVDPDRQTAASTSLITTVLVRSNPRKLSEALRTHRDTRVEDEIRLASPEAGHKKNALAKVLSWMPIGESGFLRTRERQHARAHMGDVEASHGQRKQLQNECFLWP